MVGNRSRRNTVRRRAAPETRHQSDGHPENHRSCHGYTPSNGSAVARANSFTAGCECQCSPAPMSNAPARRENSRPCFLVSTALPWRLLQSSSVHTLLARLATPHVRWLRSCARLVEFVAAVMDRAQDRRANLHGNWPSAWGRRSTRQGASNGATTPAIERRETAARPQDSSVPQCRPSAHLRGATGSIVTSSIHTSPRPVSAKVTVKVRELSAMR